MAHCNTIFHQMLKLIPRHHFAKLEEEHGTGRPARGFSRWSQTVHLLRPVARSTVADGNHRRPASFFEALFSLLYQRCQPLAPRHRLSASPGPRPRRIPVRCAASPTGTPAPAKARCF